MDNVQSKVRKTFLIAGVVFLLLFTALGVYVIDDHIKITEARKRANERANEPPAVTIVPLVLPSYCVNKTETDLLVGKSSDDLFVITKLRVVVIDMVETADEHRARIKDVDLTPLRKAFMDETAKFNSKDLGEEKAQQAITQALLLTARECLSAAKIPAPDIEVRAVELVNFIVTDISYQEALERQKAREQEEKKDNEKPTGQ